MTSPPVGAYVFEVPYWRGRPVRLTQRTFDNHKGKRPDFVTNLDEAKLTIQDPDMVGEGDNGAISLFRYGLRSYPNLYRRVIVYYRVDQRSDSWLLIILPLHLVM